MDSFTIKLLILAIAILTIVLTCFLLLYLFIKKKRYWAILPVLVLFYFLYDGLYPSDSFYKQDFEEVTGISFPEDGEILSKTATFPDQHGDYISVSLIKVDKAFYNSLLAQLKTRQRKENAEDFGGSQYFYEMLENADRQTIKAKYSLKAENGKEYTIGFLTDMETIIVERASS